MLSQRSLKPHLIKLEEMFSSSPIMEQDEYMRIHGTNIILLNKHRAVLLQLRDDKSTIPYPNMWALPGGHIQEPETPQECILREIREELGLELKYVSLFTEAERSYGKEHTYWAYVDISLKDITLSERQAVQWFTRNEIKKMQLIYEDNRIIEDFFTYGPFEIK
ncbi:NUDIX hydrolase [Ktedonosporobacter rubrisoli]|nr:NUDIX domain-containing protein [Ktedonosporobacter rubrisoli]